MKNIFYCFHLVTIITAVSVCARGADSVDPKQLGRYVVDGEFTAAVHESDRLINYYQKLVTADPQGKDAWTKMDKLQVGHYICAKAQVLALKAQYKDAEKVLQQAEDYSASHTGFGGIFAPGWMQIVQETRGLILEKKGERDAAKKTYEDILSDKSIDPSEPEDARARLALLALERGDDQEARRLALIDNTNPTACLVLARLEEKAQDHSAARDWCQKALAQLQESTILGKNNYFLPIHFCEGRAIADALKRSEKSLGSKP